MIIFSFIILKLLSKCLGTDTWSTYTLFFESSSGSHASDALGDYFCVLHMVPDDWSFVEELEFHISIHQNSLWCVCSLFDWWCKEKPQYSITFVLCLTDGARRSHNTALPLLNLLSFSPVYDWSWFGLIMIWADLTQWSSVGEPCNHLFEIP